MDNYPDIVKENLSALIREMAASPKITEYIGNIAPADRKALCTALKKACGSGGSDTDAGLEIQGDHRDGIRAFLAAKGWRVR